MNSIDANTRWLLGIIALVALNTAALAAQNVPSVYNAQGEFAGEVTASSVLLQSRLTAIPGPDLDANGDIPGANGEACFEWSETSDMESAWRTDWTLANADQDFIVRAFVTELKPRTKYYYRLLAGADRDHLMTGPIREFKTLPDSNSTQNVSFCMGSCQNYAFFMNGKNNKGGLESEEDKRLGYPAYAAMLDLQPDFFIGTGDIVYYDHYASNAAQTLPELRKKWHEQFRMPRLVAFFGKTPAFWSKDDHDFRFNDADLNGQKLPLPQTGIEIFREQMPFVSQGDQTTPSYRTHRINKHLQLWFTEGRDYRSPNKMQDGPEKSIWGTEQREWLMQTLEASDATWKIIITPTPMVGPDSGSKKDNHVNLEGFRYEADAFFKWLQDRKIGNVMTFCGDRHWQYHSIHPTGFEEFSCGALNDDNAISGTRPGDKKGTDPEALIKQPFIYPEPSGGFLHIVQAASADQSQSEQSPTLRIEFRNDQGSLLYSVTKTK